MNISAAHLSTGTLVDDVASALAATGLSPELLVVELTETSIAQDHANAVEQLQGLRAVGVRVAIDDFGSGYSTLGRLARFAVDIIKFDGDLLRSVADEREASVLRGIVEAVVAIAATISVDTLAEGIETDEQLRLAQDLGCQLAQGFGIARPMPAGDLEHLLRTQL